MQLTRWERKFFYFVRAFILPFYGEGEMRHLRAAVHKEKRNDKRENLCALDMPLQKGNGYELHELDRERLSSTFAEDDAVQVECQIDFSDSKNGVCMFSAVGYADVIKENVVYELKFVAEVTHERFLQCACYMAAMKMKKGILWNTRDNSMYSIKIKSTKSFMDSVRKRNM